MRRGKYETIFIHIIVLLLIGSCFMVSIESDESSIDKIRTHNWWNDNWKYRKTLEIESPVNNYQLFINISKNSNGDVNCSGHCQDSFNDIRFIDLDNHTILNYWIEKKIIGQYSWFWVELSDDIETDDKIMIYYGNNNATSLSNGTNTFLYYDDFSTNPIGKTQYSFNGHYEYDLEHERMKLGKNSDNKKGQLFLDFTDANALGKTINKTRVYLKIKNLGSSTEGRSNDIILRNNIENIEEHCLHWSRYGTRFFLTKTDDVEGTYLTDNKKEPYGDFYQIWIFNASNLFGYFHKYNEDNTNHFIRYGTPNNQAIQQWDEFRFHVRQGISYITLLIFMKQSSDQPVLKNCGIEIYYNETPSANFSYTPHNPTIYDIIQFNDTSLDSDGDIVSWWWDFGDNFYSSLQNPTHQYESPGNYTVCLKVTDDDGANAEYCQIIKMNIFLPFLSGWNLITLPVENDLWASDLCENISGAQSLSQWNNILQTYNTYILGGPSSFDFPIVNGWGYFVNTNKTSNLSIFDSPIESIDISLRTGWNLIGWHHEENTTASSIAENITGCLSLSKWNASTQTYNTYIVMGPDAFDFIISRGMGLFVDVNQNSTWYGLG